MKTITLTNNEKVILELCVRNLLCKLLDQDEGAIQTFQASLFNLVKGHFGDQNCTIKDPMDWVSQVQVLRDLAQKLQTEEWATLMDKYGSKESYLPQEHCDACSCSPCDCSWGTNYSHLPPQPPNCS